MKAETISIKAGRLLSLERGEYSDKWTIGMFVALRDFTPATELEMYLVEHPEQREDYNGEHDQFLAWLLARGLLLEIDYTPVHIGSYGRLEIS